MCGKKLYFWYNSPLPPLRTIFFVAGKPKKTNAMQSLALMLGPDFITDIIEVETSDHARLQIKLSFNNHFEVIDAAATAKTLRAAVSGLVCSLW